MILATSGILASISGIVYDDDAIAFFARVTAAGGTLSATEKTATNQLVLDLKANSLWTPMKAIYPMVGASAAACAQNLKSSSFTGTFNGGWTFASTGVTGNGTSAYFNSNLQPSSQLSLNSLHISYYSRTNSLTNSIDMGSYDALYAYGIELALYRNSVSYAQKTYLNINMASELLSGNQVPTGFFNGSRTASNVLKYFKNGSVIGSGTTSSINLSTQNLYIGASNELGIPRAFSSKECAFSSIGDGLTDTQASNLYTAVQAFQTTLNRQIAP